MAPTYITLPNKDQSMLPGQRGTGNYTVKLAETISFPGKWEAFLLSATIPFTWYNVTHNNNLLVFLSERGERDVRLAPGNYDSVSMLVAAITELLKDDTGTAVSVDSATMRTTITIINEHTLSGPLLELLGFPAGAHFEIGTHVSPNLVDITGGVNSLQVYVSIIENTNVGSFQVPLLATIPLGDASPGDIIHWEAGGPDYEVYELNTRSFQSIEVDIRDTRGENIDFNSYDLSIRIGIRKAR